MSQVANYFALLEEGKELRDEVYRLTMALSEEKTRADEAEAYVRALEEVCDSAQLKCAQASARQHGGAK